MKNNEIEILLSEKTEEIKKIRTVYKNKEIQVNKDFDSTMNLLKEQIDEKLNKIINQIEYFPNMGVVLAELIHNDFMALTIYYDFDSKENEKKLFFQYQIHNSNSWIPFEVLFSDNLYPAIRYFGNNEYAPAREIYLLAKGYIIKNKELILSQIENVFIPKVKEKIINLFTKEIEIMNDVIEKTDY